MLKILKITRSADFQKISKESRKFHAKSLLLLSAKTDQFYFQNKTSGKNAADFVRFGLTVSAKNVGNAVKRNQVKRRLREAVRELFPQYAKNHHDYVIIAKREAAAASLEQLSSDLKFCLKRIH